MVGSSHEASRRIFQKDPAVLTKALQRVLHVPFPEPREIVAMNVDLTEIEPVERRVGLAADPVRLPRPALDDGASAGAGPDNVPTPSIRIPRRSTRSLSTPA
ncbi:hypothetical protein [Streptomyces griseofuscus]|uniref:hypothetical protein n=1 Tax=Streptomyces griseofuscus TaxID=146922 RepID=UPI0037F207BC